MSQVGGITGVALDLNTTLVTIQLIDKTNIFIIETYLNTTLVTIQSSLYFPYLSGEANLNTTLVTIQQINDWKDLVKD